ncbi:MAG: hypothetical protein JNL80_17760 [Phycisphaerae bacterium]|jgi:hypothetical protein|nr:hypothetical protein [Phycisphaerae bacterium]
MTTDPLDHLPLSVQGERRRQAILATAEQALTGRVRARRSRRSLASFCLLIGCAVVMTLALTPTENEGPTGSETGRSVASVPEGLPPVERLTDDAMLAALAALGIDAGMIELDGEQRLVTPEGTPLDIAALNQSLGS